MTDSPPRTTIIVGPRERFGPLVPSLRSLFATIPAEIPVVVVDGGAPNAVCGKLEALRKERSFEWVHTDYFLFPHEARNIALGQVKTELLVFADNDVHYEPGWLEALERNLDENQSDIVAPLTCIGPPAASIIHQAGSTLHIRRQNALLQLYDIPRLKNQPISALTDEKAPVQTQVTEFHCFMAKTDCVREFGDLDERLITQEYKDFALRALLYKKRVTFERSAVVTYMVKEKFDRHDLDYHLLRWSHKLACRSLDAFSESWSVAPNQQWILYKQISNHRMMAMASAYPLLRRVLGKYLFKKVARRLIEAPRTQRAFRRREERPLKVPNPVSREAVDQVLQTIQKQAS